MNHTLTPSLKSCADCPWEQDDPTGTKLAQHRHRQHDEPLPPQTVTGANWQEQSFDAVRQVAARGKDFRLYDALAEFGLQSPPNHKTVLGQFAQRVHDLGIAHPVSGAPSTRPGTRASQAGVWNRNPARCISSELRCRAKAGVR